MEGVDEVEGVEGGGLPAPQVVPYSALLPSLFLGGEFPY